MSEQKIKAVVVEMRKGMLGFEFGRVQATMTISSTGTLARQLKLKKDDDVEITIRRKK